MNFSFLFDGLMIIVVLGIFFAFTLGAFYFINRKFNLSIKVKRILWALSFILITSTPFVIPVKVVVKEGLNTLKFGYPFPFIEQHVFEEKLNIGGTFYTTLINPWGHSIKHNLAINLGTYLQTILYLYLLLHVLAYLYLKFKKKSV